MPIYLRLGAVSRVSVNNLIRARSVKIYDLVVTLRLVAVTSDNIS
jgi:hypothetical protein